MRGVGKTYASDHENYAGPMGVLSFNAIIRNNTRTISRSNIPLLIVGCLLSGRLLDLWVRAGDLAVLDQPSDAYGNRVRLVITGVFAFADELCQRLGDDILFGQLVIGNEFLNRLRMYFLELTGAESPRIQVGNTDHFMQDFDHTGTARSSLLIQSLLADEDSQRTLGKIPAKFDSNLGQDLAVALVMIVFVVDIAGFLHGDFTAWIIAQEREAGAPE